MILFDRGQRPLLEFLRNLTPQVLLGTVAVLIGVTLDFRRIDLSNWLMTLAFFCCAGLLTWAVLANMSLFLDALLDEVAPTYVRINRRLRRRGASRWATVCATLARMRRRQPSIFADLLVTVVIVYVGLIVITIAALNAARQALR